MAKAKTYLGTSGYIYQHWSGTFYPENLPQNKWLEYYYQHLKSVELNVSFYRLPTASAFKGWHNRTPKIFRFAVKGSRYITHIKRLKAPAESLKLFFSRTKYLKEKLSVVLWQLPPQYKLNLERLDKFVRQLKKTTKCRQAFEFRHPSWFCDEVYSVLKKADIAVCMADYPECSKSAPDVASFLYIRRHGTGGQLYGGFYADTQLRKDADFIKSKKKDCYIYFNNDAYGNAVKNAISLKEILKKYGG